MPKTRHRDSAGWTSLLVLQPALHPGSNESRADSAPPKEVLTRQKGAAAHHVPNTLGADPEHPSYFADRQVFPRALLHDSLANLVNRVSQVPIAVRNGVRYFRGAMPTSKAAGEVLVTVAVEEKLKNAVRSQAVLQGKTFKQALDEALREWLRSSKKR